MAALLCGSGWAYGSETREASRREAARLAATIAGLRALEEARPVRLMPAYRTGGRRLTAVKAATSRPAPERALVRRTQREVRPAASIAPVAGPVVLRYGAATEAGPASGMIYAPAPGAPIDAPCGGSIDFAGPFRSYGVTLIVDCGRGTRFVLAGLDRLEVAAGARVKRGETVGRMADHPGTRDRPTLYVQERLGSRTVDPAGAALR